MEKALYKCITLLFFILIEIIIRDKQNNVSTFHITIPGETVCPNKCIDMILFELLREVDNF